MMTTQIRASSPPDADVSINEPANGIELGIRGARRLFDDENVRDRKRVACVSRTGAHRSARDRDASQYPTLP